MSDLVCVILVNWNRINDTIECINSILLSDYNNTKIVVVDNGSDNDEATQLCNLFGDKILVISLNKNFGNIRAVNIAVQEIFVKFNPKYFVMLDNDAVVDHHCLSNLVYAIKQSSDIGVVASVVYSYYDTNRVNYSGGNLNLWTDMILPSIFLGKRAIGVSYTTKIVDVTHISFWCALIDAKIFKKISINEDYFWGWEDIEFCVDILKSGWRIVVNPDSKIYHKVRSSEGKSYALQYYSNRNKFLVMKNVASKWEYAAFILYTLLICLPTISFFHLVIKRSWTEFSGLIAGIYDGLIRKKFGENA